MAADPPNITDWLQGVGTVAAFALTGAGLWWEARARRLEKSDEDLAVARSVVVTCHPGAGDTDSFSGVAMSVKTVRVAVENFAPEPVINMRVFLNQMPLVGKSSSHDGPVTVGPGRSYVAEVPLVRAIVRPEGAEATYLIPLPFPLLDYQVGGRRWYRMGTEDPIPWTRHVPGSWDVVF